MNLLEETLGIMKENNKSSHNVDFINVTGVQWRNEDQKEGTFDWNWFILYCTKFTDYDEGYGGAEVDDLEIVFKDGTWLERGEYDGSEWWEYKETPKRYKEEKN